LRSLSTCHQLEHLRRNFAWKYLFFAFSIISFA
jgi:hypothetical protein